MPSTSGLTTTQVAQRLGVKPETVYAYVSRGLLHRRLAEDGRTSRFDPDEVDGLARRGRPRRGGRGTGAVDVVLSTSLTEIADGALRYRGNDVVGLVGTYSFEDVAELLWTGILAEGHRWQALPAEVALALAATEPLPPDAPHGDRLRVATAAIAATRPLRADLRPEAVIAHARALLAALVDTLPDRRSPTPTRTAPRLAARLWTKLSTAAVTAPRVRALDAALVLLADHELASSTLAARIAASTRSDPYDVVLAGLGAVSGPVHAGAGVAAYRILREAGSGSASRALGEALRADGALPGFGHPLYPDGDPRATCLLELTLPLLSAADRAVVDNIVGSSAAVSPERPNVDFALAVLAFSSAMGPDAIEVIFALARIAGWIAHAIEEYAERPLRFRTRAIYIGDT